MNFRLLADPSELEKYLIAAGYGDILGPITPQSTPTPSTNDNFSFHEHEEKLRDPIASRPPMSPPPTEIDLPETERFTVELKKDINGLGITIAGYVCEKEELSGIFVKSVSAGSAADVSGRIQVNDRIIEVDKQSLQGFTNHDAVEVLKKSGAVVSLCLERYLRGPKYEQLQQAIAANELKPQTPSGSGTIFTASSRPHSVMSMEKGSTSELVRGPSITSPYSASGSNNSIVNDQTPPEKGRKEPSVSAASTRKLANARDSIETKVVKDKDPFEAEAFDYVPMESIPLAVEPVRPAPVGKPKYWVEPTLTKEAENTIINKWQSVLGPNSRIIVAQIRKFAVSSGLGISLEGTVDVEGGREVRPHHYIRSILAEGPVGQNGLLRSGDELLGKFQHSNRFHSEMLDVLFHRMHKYRGQWPTFARHESFGCRFHSEGVAARCSYGVRTQRCRNGAVYRRKCTQKFGFGLSGQSKSSGFDTEFGSSGESEIGRQFGHQRHQWRRLVHQTEIKIAGAVDRSGHVELGAANH